MRKIVDALDNNISIYGQDDADYTSKTRIFITSYSDSIMIYSKDEEPDTVHRFVHAVSSVCDDLYSQNVPFKGAIAKGNMTLDFNRNIFFGQPLIDAYLLHDELLFYGIVVHGSAEGNLARIDSNVLFNYNVPFKGGSASHLTVLPINFFPGKINGAKFEKFLGRINKYGLLTSGALRKYIDNTITYFNNANESNFNN